MCTSNSPSFKVRDSRLPGHFWADNEIIRDYGKRIGVYGFSAYMLLCYLARPSTVQLPLREIAALLDFSFGKLSQILDELEGCGLIQIDRETSPLTITLAALKCSPHEHDVHDMNTGVHHMNTQYNKEVIHKTNTGERLFEDGFQTIIEKEIFPYYLEHCDKHPTLYGLTPKRLKCGISRFKEAMRKTDGDSDRAKELLLGAIDAVSEDDWKMGRNKQTGGRKFNDWIDHLFGSTEKFEKLLEAGR